MKLVVRQRCFLLVSVFTIISLSGCAPKLSGYTILEIADETEVQGCKEIGLISGRSHWGGMTGQDLSLEVAKKRALNLAKAKGATHVLWLKLNKGFFGASVSGKIFFCQSSTNATAENGDKSHKIIPLSKSVTPKKEMASGSVAVMRFESAGVDSSISMVVTDIFTNQIQANGKYRVMERSQMNKILNEQGFQNSGICNSTECAVEIGRLLSIDKMFIGSIGKLGESWVINIRMINIRTGEILSNLSKQVMGKADDLSSATILMANEFSQ
jgi:PBP1b-binding outer membrane lipoprotein LpoB